MTEATQRLRLRITGNVQGVFFRATVKAWADELGIVGYVRNMAEGSVEVVGEGKRSVLEELLKRCYDGVRAARVTHIAVRWEEPRAAFTYFKIR